MIQNSKTQTRNMKLTGFVRSFHRHLNSEMKSQATIDHYVGATLQFEAYATERGWGDLDTITRPQVQEWLECLREKYRPATVLNRYLGLRAFCDWMVLEDEMDESPFGPARERKIKPPQPPESPKDVLTRDEVRRVLDFLVKAKRWRDAFVIAAIYDTGMRVGELADALVEDFAEDSGVLRIPHSKGKRPRFVRFSSETLKYLDKYHRRGNRSDPDYLISGQRQHFTRSGLYVLVRRVCEEAGIKRTIGPHDLRHTSASHLAEDGEISESDAMTLFGWKEPEMWRHYTQQARAKSALAAHERSGPLGKLRARRH